MKKSTSKKSDKKKFNKKGFITSVCCIFLGFVLGIGSVYVPKFLDNIKDDTPLTAADIFVKSRAAVLDYEYARCTINIVNLVGDTEEQFQYTASGERDTENKTLEIGDMVNNDILRFAWKRADDLASYQVYTYEDEADVWVYEQSDYVPLSVELYSVFSKTDGYTLLEEIDESDKYGKCYVLQVIGSNDVYDEVSEHIYINCDTFLPVCIVTQGITYTEKGTQEDGGVTHEVQYYDESIVRYVFEYSHESLHLFDYPTNYITAEEWAVYEASKNNSSNNGPTEKESEESSEE